MGPSNNGVLDSKAFRAHGIGSNQQAWNFSATGRIVQQQCGPQGNACSGAACLALANGLGPAVIKTRGSTTDEFCANTSTVDGKACFWNSAASGCVFCRSRDVSDLSRRSGEGASRPLVHCQQQHVEEQHRRRSVVEPHHGGGGEHGQSGAHFTTRRVVSSHAISLVGQHGPIKLGHVYMLCVCSYPAND